jgi:ABC-type sulfate transport system substrate-binding protein
VAKKKNDKNKKFEFPNSVLNQIEECSSGGFVLFTFDDDGLPEVHSSFESMQSALGMQYYVSSWSKAIDAINVEATISSMEQIPPASPEEEF